MVISREQTAVIIHHETLTCDVRVEVGILLLICHDSKQQAMYI